MKLKKRAQAAEKEVLILQKKITSMTKKQENCLDCSLHGDLLHIITEKTPEIKQVYPEGSFSRMFWERQLQAASVKDPCQVRWHPVMICWCQILKLLSSSA